MLFHRVLPWARQAKHPFGIYGVRAGYIICYMEGCEKLPHQFIPSKTASMVTEFAVEDLPLGRTAALVPEFAVKDLPLGRTL